MKTLFINKDITPFIDFVEKLPDIYQISLFVTHNPLSILNVLGWTKQKQYISFRRLLIKNPIIFDSIIKPNIELFELFTKRRTKQGYVSSNFYFHFKEMQASFLVDKPKDKSLIYKLEWIT